MKYKHPRELSEGTEVTYILDQRKHVYLKVQIQSRIPQTPSIEVQLLLDQDLVLLPILQNDLPISPRKGDVV